MLAPEPTTILTGWKEIAAHLGVEKSTAQRWAKQRGLPVRYLPGSNSRVVADRAALDAWILAGRSVQDSGPADPPPAEQPPASRPAQPRQRVYLFAAAATLFGAAASYGWFVSHRLMDGFRLQGSTLVGTTAEGTEIWRRALDDPQGEQTKQDLALHTWLGDLNGDGHKELLFLTEPSDAARKITSTLVCFNEHGKVMWRFPAGRPVTDASGDHMLPPYGARQVMVMRGKKPTDTRIVVSSSHYLSQPHQVAFLDPHGIVVGEYWHPGHLMAMSQADLDGGGRNELLLAGVNNGNHQATLVVLDPLLVRGAMTPTQMRDDRFRLLGMPAAHEKAVVFFPRSCLSTGKPFTVAAGLFITPERIMVQVAEEPATASPELVYEFDYGLRPTNVVPTGDAVRIKHQEMEAKGELDHPYSLACWTHLKDQVVVQRAP